MGNEHNDEVRLPDFWLDNGIGLLPRAETKSWGVEYLKAPQVWPKADGKGVIVFVLDTEGSHFDHPDVRPFTLSEHCRSFTGETGADANGLGQHGLHVAHTILQVAPGARTVFVKVLRNSGSGSIAAVAAGIRYVADLGVAGATKMINLSLGSNIANALLQEALQYAVSKGVIVCAAAGNDGGAVDYPGAYDSATIAVGAIDRTGTPAAFSSRGPQVDVAAPGVGIIAAWGTGYAAASGTSMATPHVAGALAVILSARSDLDSFGKALPFLVDYATDLHSDGRDDETGFGAPVLTGYPLESTGPKPEPDPPADPPGEPGKKPLPWWAWALIGAGAVLIALFVLLAANKWKLY